MSQDNSVSGTALLSPQAADEHVYRSLSLFIGQGRRYSVDDISTGTGIAARNVSAWIANAVENRRRPKACQILMLCQFIGVELTNKLLSPIGQGGRMLDPAENEPSVVVAKLAAGVAEFAARGADGIFCHVDRAALEDDADMIIATVTPFSSRGRP